MGDQRAGGITWTDETWNPIRGCRRVNQDCVNCYAERLAATRLSSPPVYDGTALVKAGGPYWGLAEMKDGKPRWTGQIDLVEDKLKDPLGWTRPRMVFVNAMSDLFFEDLAFEQVDRMVAVMALSGRHVFQVLTKRWARMADYLESRARDIGYLERAARDLGHTFSIAPTLNPKHGSTLAWPIPNIWWGGSAGHQKAMDEAGPHLLRCRPHAKILWLSAEPLWAPMSIAKWLPHTRETSQTSEHAYAGVDWVVAGGESGPGARPVHPNWARVLLAECRYAGVPFHFKQWGEWVPSDQRTVAISPPVETLVNATTGQDTMGYYRVGKKAAGRLLDGVVHNAFPGGRAA